MVRRWREHALNEEYDEASALYERTVALIHERVGADMRLLKYFAGCVEYWLPGAKWLGGALARSGDAPGRRP